MKKNNLKIFCEKGQFSKKKILKVANGFSLVEVLFSLLVLTLGIVGVVLIMTANIKVYVEAKNQIIAAQLVQAGTELVKNLNDNGQFTDGTSYLNYKVDANVSTSPATIRFVSAGTNYQLYLDSNGFYSHTSSGGTSTKYIRRIDIDGTSAVGQRKVTSKVAWDGTGTFPATCNISSKCISSVLVISY